MNEVVSPAYTLTVYGAAEHELAENPIRKLVEQLLSLARLSTKGTYIFKVLKFQSPYPAPRLEFEHTGKDLVYNYRCRIGNVAGLTGIFHAVLRIPDNEGLHSGITEELNAAAVKLLAETQATPPPLPEVTLPTTAEVPPREVISSTLAPLRPTLAPPRPAPSPPPVPTPTRSKTRAQGPEKLRKKESGLTENFGAKLALLKQQVAAERTKRREEIARQTAELAKFDSLQQELEELELKWLRQQAAHERLKKFT